LTICSSENLVFFMVPSLAEGPLSQSINWTENRPAGQVHFSQPSTPTATNATMMHVCRPTGEANDFN
jgi:hypothetical protein